MQKISCDLTSQDKNSLLSGILILEMFQGSSRSLQCQLEWQQWPLRVVQGFAAQSTIWTKVNKWALHWS